MKNADAAERGWPEFFFGRVRFKRLIPSGNPPPPIGGCAAADAQISATPQAIEMSNLAFIVLLLEN